MSSNDGGRSLSPSEETMPIVPAAAASESAEVGSAGSLRLPRPALALSTTLGAPVLGGAKRSSPDEDKIRRGGEGLLERERAVTLAPGSRSDWLATGSR